jgi:hypothetical protein
MGERSQSPALGVGEGEPEATELGFEDAVFRGFDLTGFGKPPADNRIS